MWNQLIHIPSYLYYQYYFIIQMEFQNQEQQQTFFIHTLAEILEGVIQGQSNPPLDSDMFSSKVIPTITIQQYLFRIKNKSKCSIDALILALIYIDKYSQTDRNFILSGYNLHRLLLVCILISVKYHDDFYYDNSTFALAGGIALNQLNELEVHLLKMLNFELFINCNQFNQYKSKIIEAVSDQ